MIDFGIQQWIGLKRKTVQLIGYNQFIRNETMIETKRFNDTHFALYTIKFSIYCLHTLKSISIVDHSIGG